MTGSHIGLENKIVRVGLARPQSRHPFRRLGITHLVRTSPAIKEVHDHLVWVEPMSGMMISSAEDEEAARKKDHD